MRMNGKRLLSCLHSRVSLSRGFQGFRGKLRGRRNDRGEHFATALFTILLRLQALENLRHHPAGFAFDPDLFPVLAPAGHDDCRAVAEQTQGVGVRVARLRRCAPCPPGLSMTVWMPSGWGRLTWPPIGVGRLRRNAPGHHEAGQPILRQHVDEILRHAQDPDIPPVGIGRLGLRLERLGGPEVQPGVIGVKDSDCGDKGRNAACRRVQRQKILPQTSLPGRRCAPLPSRFGAAAEQAP